MNPLAGVEYPTNRGHTVQVFHGARGWQWWALSGNGVIAARGPQTYTRKDAAVRAARRVFPPQHEAAA